MKKSFLILALFLIASPFLNSQDYEKKYVTIIPGEHYAASGFFEFWLGEHWRDVWTTPIKVEILNLETFAGGLMPIEKGGGLQTKSLKFLGKDGKQYRFRSIDKDVRRSLPQDFGESIVADIMQDQVSVINPASSVVVAPLMDAFNILNSKPIIYLLPDDDQLGEFRDEFADVLGTIEENPEDYDDKSLNFAGADKIVNTFDLYEKLQEDNSEKVDAVEFLKARLMDIIIGDRDRHAGQWNWAGYKQGKTRIWKPIPKDRDFSFPLYDGLIPRIMTIAITSLVHFDYNMPSMLDMTWEGRHMDRRLLGELEKNIWDSVATFMQNQITDEVIEQAVKQMPEEHFQLEGDNLISKLKSRRNQLKYASDDFYSWNSKYVDVYCSDEDEFAEIIRLNDSLTIVNVYERNKVTGDNKSERLFHRILHNCVSDEVRIHLLGGDDLAIITGAVDKGIRVIIEGGEGKDELIDSSIVNGYFLSITPIPSVEIKTEFYDSGKKTVFIKGAGTYVNKDNFLVSEDLQQRYEPKIEDRYRDYNVLIPFEYNNDDGFVLGIGGRINYYDFRKSPFAHRYELTGSYATLSKRAEFIFLGSFNDIFENVKVKLPAKFSGLEITRFYGFGNETTRNEDLVDEGYYNVSQRYIGAGVYLDFPLFERIDLNTGLLFELSNVLEQEDRLLNEINPYGTGSLDLYALSALINWDSRDDKELPFTGYYFDFYGDIYPPSLNNKNFFGKIVIDGRSYFSAKYITDFTLALRAYSEVVWGKYPFYKGASVGGSENLRGFTRDRYVGDLALLGSAELRYHLSKVYFLIPFKLGMNIFTDSGRVFFEGEESSKWHTAFGGGLWISINDRAINLSLNVAKSPETLRFYLSIGQMF